MQENFIEMGHPPKDHYERLYRFLVKKSDGANMVHATGEEIEAGSKVGRQYHYAIMEALHGSRVLESAKDEPKVHKVKLLRNSELGRFIQLKDALIKLAARDGDWFLFDLDVIANSMDIGVATVKKNMKAWVADKLIAWEEPPRGDPTRIIGDLSLVDFDRLQAKKRKALSRLDYVKGYFRVPDSQKHDYLNDYFLNL